MKIARVFPRRTSATPTDDLAFTSLFPPRLTLPEIDEIHISVAFTYDMPRAECMEKEWRMVGVPVKMGGPAFNQPSYDFVPELYVEKGYTITSRGCPNNCWFCAVPKRDGNIRELEIKDGWNILDDNLLACSDQHIKSVFEMLSRQPQPPNFTGGIEAARLKLWHCKEIRKLKPKSLYFAYDTPNDLDPLIEAGKLLRSVGFTFESHNLKCYVLAGYERDTFEKAEKRFRQTIDAGFMPYVMPYKNDQGIVPKEWRKFLRAWSRPEMVGCRIKEMRISSEAPI